MPKAISVKQVEGKPGSVSIAHTRLMITLTSRRDRSTTPSNT